MRKLLILVALFGCPSIGQIRNALEDADITSLKTAKTAALLLDMAEPMNARYVPNYERAKKQALKKLGEVKGLVLVKNPAEADIVIVVREFNQSNGTSTATAYSTGGYTTATAHENICLADTVSVYKGGAPPSAASSLLWAKSDSCGFSWPLNRLLDAFKKARK